MWEVYWNHKFNGSTREMYDLSMNLSKEIGKKRRKMVMDKYTKENKLNNKGKIRRVSEAERKVKVTKLLFSQAQEGQI